MNRGQERDPELASVRWPYKVVRARREGEPDLVYDQERGRWLQDVAGELAPLERRAAP